MKNKRGLSGIVAALLLIGLTLAAVTIVWGVVRNLLDDQMEQGEACFAIFDQVYFNPRYTCEEGGFFYVSVGVRDIELDEILITVEGNKKSHSFTLKEDGEIIPNIKEEGSFYSNSSIPGRNSGKTYRIDLTGIGMTIPDAIRIAPTVNGQRCGESDRINEIESCLAAV